MVIEDKYTPQPNDTDDMLIQKAYRWGRDLSWVRGRPDWIDNYPYMKDQLESAYNVGVKFLENTAYPYNVW